MTKPMEPGMVRIAHTRSGETGEDEVVVAEFDAQGVTVSWPRALEFHDAMALNQDERCAPDPLILRDGAGWLTLTEPRIIGASASTLEHSVERIQYSRAIHAGTKGADYATVNGMATEIDGLAMWAKLVPVTREVTYEKDRLASLSLVARNLEPKALGGPLGLELTTSYTHDPAPQDGVFTVSTSLLVRTRSPELTSWETHLQSHRMLQDLTCLVYGKPCASRLVSVMREDDQELPPNDERRFWREAYQPTSGRAVAPSFQLTDQDQPLFFLDEADPERVERWLSEYELWSRPTWIAMSAIFDRSLPVESKLLQVAVALEALGYAISKRANRNPARPPQFTALLKRIFEALGYEPPAVVGDTGNARAWRGAFNRAYNGVNLDLSSGGLG